jgi:hypothetical protein
VHSADALDKPFRTVFPVVHTPYDYEQRNLKR